MWSDAVRAVYDAVAHDYASMLPDTSFEAPEDIALLERFVALLPRDGRVVDAGCGAGRMLDALAAMRPDLSPMGVDIAPRMIAEARLRLPDADLAVADLARLPAPAGTVHGVLAWYSIIHTPADELAPVAAEFARVLAPGGVVLAAFQSGRGVRTIERAYGHDVSIDAVLHEPRAVATRFAALGFTVLDEVERAARPGERHPQGFVLAQR